VLVTSFFIIAEIVVVAPMCTVYKVVAFPPLFRPWESISGRDKPFTFAPLYVDGVAVLMEASYFHCCSGPYCSIS
jgi:hypothetical protein